MSKKNMSNADFLKILAQKDEQIKAQDIALSIAKTETEKAKENAKVETKEFSELFLHKDKESFIKFKSLFQTIKYLETNYFEQTKAMFKKYNKESVTAKEFHEILIKELF